MKLPTTIPILLGMSLAGGAALGMLYMLFKEDKKDKCLHKVTSVRSRTEKVSVKIPKEYVGLVIGRQGSNIKNIQGHTKTKIIFKQERESDAFSECIISGSGEGTATAESIIYKIITTQPKIITDEMQVPARACGLIVGRNGDNIRNIIKVSGASIIVEDDGDFREDIGERRVSLTGYVKQIALAKRFIQEKVNDDALLRERFRLEAAGSSQSAPEDEEQPVNVSQHKQRLVATSGADMVEVYVSAIESPGRFWVQSVSPSSVELDQLQQNMTKHYSVELHQHMYSLRKDLIVGQIVAAPYFSDDNWYRAQVLSVSSCVVQIFYLDYGDTDNMLGRDLLALRPDFLGMKFQAIECTLANVKPSSGAWTYESIDLFEAVTQVAQRKAMMCSIEACEQHELRTGEDSPAPAISLFDFQGPSDVNVADKLVQCRHAVYTDPQKAAEFSDRQRLGSLSGSEANGADLSHSADDTMASMLSFSGHSGYRSAGGSEGSRLTSPTGISANFISYEPQLVSETRRPYIKRYSDNAAFRKATPNYTGDMEFF